MLRITKLLIKACDLLSDTPQNNTTEHSEIVLDLLTITAT